MQEIVSLLSEADSVALSMEQAKVRIEAAKAEVDAAKQELDRLKEAYSEVLSEAEKQGFSRGKMKKLVEDRMTEMASLSLISGASSAKPPKKSRKKKSEKKAEPLGEEPLHESSGDSEASVKPVEDSELASEMALSPATVEELPVYTPPV